MRLSSFSSSSDYESSDWSIHTVNSGHTLVSPIKIAKNKKLSTLSKKEKKSDPSEAEFELLR